jgi:glutaredoxin
VNTYNSLLEESRRMMSPSTETVESQLANNEASPEESLRERFRSGLGSLLLFLGVALLSLLAADRTAGLPVNLPSSWYTDRAVWVGAGLLAFGAGWYLLGDRESATDRERTKTARGGPGSRPSGLRFERVVLYTRSGCHLCDVARETLAKYHDSLPVPVEIDIDADAELQARFATCVPVVEIDGKVRFRGQVNEVLLRRLIEATPPRPLD